MGGGGLEGSGKCVGKIVSKSTGVETDGMIAVSSATDLEAERVVDSTEEFTEIVREIEI